MRGISAALGVLAVVALILAWQLTPLAAIANPETINATMARVSATWWGPAIVLAMFLAAGLIVFPTSLLVVAVAAAFGPWLGFAYSGVGVMASATLNYVVGRWLGGDVVAKALGSRLDFLKTRGVLAVAIARNVPGVPFAVASLAAGASGVGLLDYLAGTALAVVPAVAVLSALGYQIFRIMIDPSAAQLAMLVAAIVLWVAVALAVEKVIRKLNGA